MAHEFSEEGVERLLGGLGLRGWAKWGLGCGGSMKGFQTLGIKGWQCTKIEKGIEYTHGENE